MKSNVCVIKKGCLGLENVLAEVEKVTGYNGLQKKEALRLRLLAEELVGMLEELVKNFDGSFWIQSNGDQYELHTEIFADMISKEKKEALIAVSLNKKNAAASGFMNKIRDIAENMLLYSENSSSGGCYEHEYLYEYGMQDVCYTRAWTLEHYRMQQEIDLRDESEEWDRLEQSIVAKLADDVIVGVRGQKVEIIIKKKF